jgi:hypothetical protein
MAANNHDKHDPAIRHETTDVNIGPIAKAVVGVVLLAVASYVFIWGILRYFNAREDAAQTVAPRALRVPPLPRLQSTPVPDLKAVIDAENHMLQSYAWVNKDKGLVRIPIDQAIDLLAKRGLPVRPAAPPASGVSEPTEASLGVGVASKP